MSQILSFTASDYPPEILQEIITHTSDDNQTLKALCLTDLRFRNLAQRALFRNTKIRGYLKRHGTYEHYQVQVHRINQLHGIIQSREELGLLVKNLEFDLARSTLPSDETVFQAAYMLSTFKQVERITISFHPFDASTDERPFDPNFAIDSPLRKAIPAILQSPGLREVIFDNFDQLLPALLLHLGPSVKSLTFANQTFFPFDDIQEFDMSAQDILDGYSLNPYKEPPKHRVMIESLEIEVVSRAMLVVLDKMLDSPFCPLDFSQVTLFSAQLTGSQEPYLDSLGLFYKRFKNSLKAIDTFSGDGLLLPKSMYLDSFPNLQVQRAFLGLHTEGNRILDDYLTLLQYDETKTNSPLLLRKIYLVASIGEDSFDGDIWARIAEVLGGRRFPNLQDMKLTLINTYSSSNPDIWIRGIKDAMKPLVDKGVLRVELNG